MFSNTLSEIVSVDLGKLKKKKKRIFKDVRHNIWLWKCLLPGLSEGQVTQNPCKDNVLFNGAVGSGHDDSWIMNRKGYGRKRVWVNLRY
jgi:hypothetical protein